MIPERKPQIAQCESENPVAKKIEKWFVLKAKAQGNRIDSVFCPKKAISANNSSCYRT